MHVLVALAKGLGCLDVNTLKSEIQHLKAPKNLFSPSAFSLASDRWDISVFVFCVFAFSLVWRGRGSVVKKRKEKVVRLFARPATDLHCFMPLYNDKSLGIGQLGVQFGNNRINV